MASGLLLLRCALLVQRCMDGALREVALTEDIHIRRAGVRVDSGVLRPGQRVRVLMRTTRGEIAGLEILD